MDTKTPSSFQGVPTQNLLESLLEIYPFMPVLILTLSIYYHIFLLLIFTYQSKIPFSSSTPRKCGGRRQAQAQGTTKRRRQNSSVENQGRAGGFAQPSPGASIVLVGAAQHAPQGMRNRSQLPGPPTPHILIPELLRANTARARQRVTRRSHTPMAPR